MPYIPALNGLRALAILLVMANHATLAPFFGGYLGVDIFFVLSGFLITSILLEEISSTGTIDLPQFYKRRLRRLMPALICLLLFYLALAPLAWPAFSWRENLRDVLLVGFYLSDYSCAFWQIPLNMGHTWSLAVEEHFYMVWPLVLLALVRFVPREKLSTVLIGFYVAATLLRIGWYMAGQTWAEVYNRTDTHLSGLMLGALLAVLIRDKRISLSSPLRLCGIIGVFILIVTTITERNFVSLTFSITIAEFVAFFLIADVMHNSQSFASRLLSLPSFTFIGRISYGLYLYHLPIFIYLMGAFGMMATLLFGVPVSIALAAASYFLVERGFLKSKVVKFKPETLAVRKV